MYLSPFITAKHTLAPFYSFETKSNTEPSTPLEILNDFLGLFYSYLKRWKIELLLSGSFTDPAIRNWLDFNGAMKEFWIKCEVLHSLRIKESCTNDFSYAYYNNGTIELN